MISSAARREHFGLESSTQNEAAFIEIIAAVAREVRTTLTALGEV